MPRTLYHTLKEMPRFLEKSLSSAEEQFATRLVRSGLIRIDAGERQNFINYTDPHAHLRFSFSARELYDPALTKRILPRLEVMVPHMPYRGTFPQRVNQLIEQLKVDIHKRGNVSEKLELQLARLLLTAAEQPILELMLIEQIELFISFGNSVGDVMDIKNWKESGANSGLQGQAIFVSSGGNPFLDPEESHYTGDGFPAMARFIIIAAQEMAHFSDIIRNKNGDWIGRYSSNLSLSKPAKEAKYARYSDFQNLQQCLTLLNKSGAKTAARLERSVLFYRRQKHHRLSRQFLRFFAFLLRIWVINFSRARKISWLNQLPPDAYPASQWFVFIEDMQANVAPDAEVYRNPDPEVEEAIACAEAIARVPQQATKWGKSAVLQTTPALSTIFYGRILPQCISYIESRSGKKFQPLKKNLSPLRRFRARLELRKYHFIKRQKSALLEFI
jgi:hypothetical protein